MATAEKHRKRSAYSSHIKAPYAALNRHGYTKRTEKMYRDYDGALQKLIRMISRARKKKNTSEDEE